MSRLIRLVLFVVLMAGAGVLLAFVIIGVQCCV